MSSVPWNERERRTSAGRADKTDNNENLRRDGKMTSERDSSDCKAPLAKRSLYYKGNAPALQTVFRFFSKNRRINRGERGGEICG
jgi:hypothetical protein